MCSQDGHLSTLPLSENSMRPKAKGQKAGSPYVLGSGEMLLIRQPNKNRAPERLVNIKAVTSCSTNKIDRPYQRISYGNKYNWNQRC